MKNRILPGYLFRFVAVVMILLVSACVSTPPPLSNQPAKPIAVISSPQNEAQVGEGQEVLISFTAADVKGISQVELLVDGQPLHVKKVEPSVNSFAASQVWTPTRPGSHVIELRAFNVDNEPSDPVQVFITVGETGAPITPLPDETLGMTPSPTGQETLPLPNDTITPIPTGSTPSLPAGDGPIVTTLVGLNVRSGPGTDYPVVGRLLQNQALAITGRNSEGTWWQIAFPLGSNERGWISGSAQYSQASNTKDVPVVPAPPKPTPATPTATPVPVLPVIRYFRADRDTIDPGGKVILSWDLSDAKEAFLRYDDVTEGITAPNSKTLSPTKTTVYTLLARGHDGDTTAQVIVKVNEATATPVPVRNDGKSKILGGQTIDFDRGVIQGPDGAGADFYWDGQHTKILPRNGATGAFVGDVFEDITLANCRSVTYGQPLPELGAVSRITGCYHTNEGRYGKFFVTEWNADDVSLTIQWLTWDLVNSD